MAEARSMPALRRAWLAEMGVEHIWLGGTAAPAAAGAAAPAPQPKPEPQPEPQLEPQPEQQPELQSEPEPGQPVAAANVSSGASTVGELVCRVYRAGEGVVWLVVVDAVELGRADSGQRLFLGRMLRAMGLRRTEAGADLALLAREDGLRCAQPLDVACVGERPTAVLLVGGRAARALIAADNAGAVELQGRRVPLVALPALSDVSVDAAGKARAWRLMCDLRGRAG